MKELVTVVIPLSGAPLSESEKASLRRCREVLGAYPLIAIMPSETKTEQKYPELADLDTYTFEVPSRAEGWERLFLHDELYERFDWSEFILIHRLNSLVLRDELHYWCKQGYDYIQAPPVLPPTYQPGILEKMGEETLGIKPQVPLPVLHQAVAGTGLSLRRVERARNVIRSNRRKIYALVTNPTLTDQDALFWEGQARRFWPALRVPTSVVRQRFSLHAASLSTLREVPEPKPFALTGLDTWTPEQRMQYLT